MVIKINKQLLPFKAHFFFKSGGLAFLPILTTICRQKGLTGQSIGIIWTVTPIASAVINIIFGAIADIYKLHRILLQVTCTIMFIFLTGFFFLPSIPTTSTPIANINLSAQCDDNGEFSVFCAVEEWTKMMDNGKNPLCSSRSDLNNSRLADSCSMTCQDASVHPYDRVGPQGTSNSSVSDYFLIQLRPLCHNGSCYTLLNTELPEIVNNDCSKRLNITCDHLCLENTAAQEMSLTYLLGTVQFWMIFLFVVVSCSNLHVSSTLGDTLCSVALGKDSHKFGRQRLFGAMGIGIMALIGGALVNYFSKGRPEPDYTPAIVITASFGFISLLFTPKLQVDVPSKESGGSTVGDVFCSFRFWLLIGSVAVTGLSYGVIWTFEYIYMEDVAKDWDPDFDDAKLLQGIVLFTDCFIGEVLFFFFSSDIIRKLTSVHTFTLTLAATSLRVTLYSIVKNPWLFIPIHLLHGISFGVFFANMISSASQLAPKGSQATLQSAVIACFTLGRSFGAFGGGLLLQAVGGSKTFLYLGIIVFIYTVIYVIITCVIMKKISDQTAGDERGEYRNPNKDKAVNGITEKGDDVSKPQIFESQNLLEAMA